MRIVWRGSCEFSSKIVCRISWSTYYIKLKVMRSRVKRVAVWHHCVYFMKSHLSRLVWLFPGSRSNGCRVCLARWRVIIRWQWHSVRLASAFLKLPTHYLIMLINRRRNEKKLTSRTNVKDFLRAYIRNSNNSKMLS